MTKLLATFWWFVVAGLGAYGYAVLALHRAERISSVYILLAALCSYAIGYRFYSKWIAARILTLNDRRATPCEVHDDGRDYVKTNKWIVFGHHFAAISGPGPLVGPVLAAQFGYLPSAIWILVGVVLGGAVQDFVILFCSMRRNGKSLAQMVKEELNNLAGGIALAAILAIMIILLAVLALVVVKALAESPWGIFTVGATIPIAMVMGGYLRFWRIGKVLEASVIGVILLLLAVWGGQFVHGSPVWSKTFSLSQSFIAWSIIIYGLAASILPVWLLLAPRDYLSTFMKLGTIFALVVGVFAVLPELKMPAITKFIDGSGLVVAGKLFPFCFITIACGAISGFHTLISSGTTPKIITRENYSRHIGYGAMLLESLVAIMALIAACSLDPGVYLSMNIKGAGATPEAIAQDTISKVQAVGFNVTAQQMHSLADEVQEQTLFGRTGGAATLAVGMAGIFARVTKGYGLGLWYHFAIMFEALFILTTLDAGTRVGRYLLQDFLGNLWKPLGDTKSIQANVFASILVVAAWGYFLIQGVRDPLGGINSLWPLFGIANQLLAAIALCLATTVILKMQLTPVQQIETPGRFRHPSLVLITLVPLVWLLAVTITAGVQKISSPDPRIGFISQARTLAGKTPALQQTLTLAKQTQEATPITAAEKALRNNQTLIFNQYLDATVTAIFLALVAAVTLICLWEWYRLLARRRSADLKESEPVWLPDYAIIEGKPLKTASVLALSLTLMKELSGEADMERTEKAQLHACSCENQAAEPNNPHLTSREQQFLDHLDARYKSIRRCC
jgi:carbon starvation protein